MWNVQLLWHSQFPYEHSTLRNRRKHTEREKEGEMKISQWYLNDLFFGTMYFKCEEYSIYRLFNTHNYNNFAGKIILRNVIIWHFLRLFKLEPVSLILLPESVQTVCSKWIDSKLWFWERAITQKCSWSPCGIFFIYINKMFFKKKIEYIVWINAAF